MLTFACGHPATPKNTGKAAGWKRCLACRRERYRHDPLDYRVRILPKQLERARHRVRQLEAEAIALGFHDLVERRA